MLQFFTSEKQYLLSIETEKYPHYSSNSLKKQNAISKKIKIETKYLPLVLRLGGSISVPSRNNHIVLDSPTYHSTNLLFYHSTLVIPVPLDCISCCGEDRYTEIYSYSTVALPGPTSMWCLLVHCTNPANQYIIPQISSIIRTNKTKTEG